MSIATLTGNKYTKLLWVILTLLSASGFLFSWKYFTKSFPIMHVEATAPRRSILLDAQALADRLRLAPDGAKSAVEFTCNPDVQNFFALEGGGDDAFFDLVDRKVIEACIWRVRLFAEKNPNEVSVYFAADGRPLGFKRTVPEALEGAALSGDDARPIAVKTALSDWGIDLSENQTLWQLVEQSSETRPNGRVDHSFTYERGDLKLGVNGEGRIRYRAVVSGDQLSEIDRQVKIPEAFSRRFANMRSDNETLFKWDTIVFVLLYGIGGLVVGSLMLRRNHALLHKPAMKLALAVALLQFAAMLNGLPGSWLHYDTAHAYTTHIAQILSVALVGTLGLWILASLVLAGGEGLSRQSFARHPQLWSILNRGIGNSPAVLGRAVGGYLWVGVNAGFITAFYLIAHRYFGWWQPNEMLADPNILATPFPFIAPVANAFQAGVLEECLFRAVPLAGAAWLGGHLGRRCGGRLGGRTTWIVVALIAQAIIFGCAHANYPQQPFFCRPAELFLPSLAWGLVYLRFGLLPGILFHFLFDLMMMSIPLFATPVPGLLVDQVIVIAVALLPLLIIARLRLAEGRMVDFPDSAWNGAWRSEIADHDADEPAALVVAENCAARRRARLICLLMGAAGLIAVPFVGNFKADNLPLLLDRAAAEKAADAALAERGVDLAQGWHRFSVVNQNAGDGLRFVVRESGRDVFDALRGRYVGQTGWRVRYVRFDGDVADRAEEWNVFVTNGIGDGSLELNTPVVENVRHTLPDAREAPPVTEDEARAAAGTYLVGLPLLRDASLREIAATASQHPNRKDWTFTFDDEAVKSLKKGEARVSVSVAGHEITDIKRFVHVPEEWQREFRDQTAKRNLVMTGLSLPFGLVMLAVVVTALMRAGKSQMDKRVFALVSLALAALGVLCQATHWESDAVALVTTTPLQSQILTLAGQKLLGIVLESLIVGVLAGLILKGDGRTLLGSGGWRKLLLPGFAFLVAFDAFLSALPPNMPLPWHGLAAMNDAWPFLAKVAWGLRLEFVHLVEVTYLLIRLQEFSRQFTVRKWQTIAIVFVIGLIGGTQSQDVGLLLMSAAASGAVLVLVYLLVIRFEPRLFLFACLYFIDQIGPAVHGDCPNAAVLPAIFVACNLAAFAIWATMLEWRKDATR